MKINYKYLYRALDLAKLGAGKTGSNPMVGAVIVYKDTIIGEGFHKEEGRKHAEVIAVDRIKPSDRPFLSKSTMYVSLEPCSIFGKTPPCTNLIIRNKIPRVVIARRDQTPSVNGNGVRLLKEAGVEVIEGEFNDLVSRRSEELTATREHIVKNDTPYVILKYAESINQIFAPLNAAQLWISNIYSKRLVHKTRSEVDGIMVGTNTALVDDPELTNRYYLGKSPVRVVPDRQLRLDPSSKLFQGPTPTLCFTEKTDFPTVSPTTSYITLDFNAPNYLHQLLVILREKGIHSLMVEGGIHLLNSFIEQNLWNEANILKNNIYIAEGRKAPQLNGEVQSRLRIDNDELIIIKNDQSQNLTSK